MNINRLFKNNLLLGLLLSIILTATVIPFIKLGGKYNLIVQKELSKNHGYVIIYKDIDHDGTSDKITIIRDFGGFSALLMGDNKFPKFEWNLYGIILNDDFYCTGDVNGDGTDEIFVFTSSNDSIFVNGFDVLKLTPLWPPIFISKFKFLNGGIDVSVSDPQMKDLRHNGQKELVFNLFSGFSKSRRAICTVNIKNKRVRFSPKAGSSPSHQLYFSDLSGNGSEDIMGEVSSYGNFSLKYPFSDSLLWFCVYNSNLDYLFKPEKLGNYPGSVWIYPIKIDNKNRIALCVDANQRNDSSFIAIANGKGKILRYKKLNQNKRANHYYFKVFQPDSRYRLALYCTNNGFVEYYDKKLNRIGTYQSVPVNDRVYDFDLDGDGQKESVYFGQDMDHLVVSRNDFKDPVVLKFNGEEAPYYFSEKWKNGKPEALCLSLTNKYYEFIYKKNLYYTYRLLIYGIIFLLIFFLVTVIGFYYQRLLKLRYRAEEKIRVNQQQAIDQQLNPHFILNLLNSIGALYEKNESETAQIYMGKYGKLLRENLMASGEISSSFEHQMNFVQNYLDLEQFRYNNNFSYSISCEGLTIPIQLPRLLIYTFVENALKHGLFHVMGSQQAHLNIHCSDQLHYWMIEIIDNGIGRKEAAKIISYSTGKGLEILDETLRLYKSIKHRRISFKVEDLYPKEKYTGTKVTILIRKKKDEKQLN